MQFLIPLVALGVLLLLAVILWIMGALGSVTDGAVHLFELLRIAWRNIRQRGVASFLTASSMALGIMLLVCVLSMVGVVSRQFDNNASLGYNLLIGAKGGSLQLTLNSVFYLSKPIENIPYEYYLECKTQAERKEFIEKNAVRSDVIRVQWEVAELQNAQAAALRHLDGTIVERIFGLLRLLVRPRGNRSPNRILPLSMDAIPARARSPRTEHACE